MTPKIKICGLTRAEDIAAVNEAKVDYAGFVFFEKSKRNLSFEQAVTLKEQLDPSIHAVAVCVSPDEILVNKIQELGFDILQIHGALKEALLDHIDLPVWQAVNISNGIEPVEFLEHPKITGYVVDGANYGGGQTFGWDVNTIAGRLLGKALREKAKDKLVILAGGLNSQNVCKGMEIFQPDLVDVSSGVETENKKDKELIDQFVSEVRKS